MSPLQEFYIEQSQIISWMKCRHLEQNPCSRNVTTGAFLICYLVDLIMLSQSIFVLYWHGSSEHHLLIIDKMYLIACILILFP